MSATSNRLKSARRHLDVFEESWKADHDEAMRCRDLEGHLATGVLFFDYFEWLNRSWRDLIYRGVEKWKAEDEEVIKFIYTDWLQVTDEVIAALSEFEKTFGVVEHGDKIRTYRERARQTLEAWTPPVVARSPASRVWDVSEEQADELRKLLSAPPGAPGRLKIEPKSVPLGEAKHLR